MTAEREGLAEIEGVLAEHLPRDRFREDGESVGTYCTCGKWEGDYFADGESGPFDAHLAHALADLLAARDRRVRAEAVREYRDALAENESAEFWSTRDAFLHDLSDWAKCTEEGIA